MIFLALIPVDLEGVFELMLPSARGVFLQLRRE